MFRRRSDCSAIGQYQRGGGEVGRVTMRHHPAGRGHPSHGVLVQGRGRGTVVHVSGSINSFLSDSFLKEKKTDTVTLSRDTKLALLNVRRCSIHLDYEFLSAFRVGLVKASKLFFPFFLVFFSVEKFHERCLLVDVAEQTPLN